MTTQRASNRDLGSSRRCLGPLAYIVYMAPQNHLMYPGRYKPGSAIYAGPAAWTFFIAVVCLWLGVSVRIGLPQHSQSEGENRCRVRAFVYRVAGIYGAGYLPTVTHVP